jgi:hypothetical protein
MLSFIRVMVALASLLSKSTVTKTMAIEDLFLDTSKQTIRISSSTWQMQMEQISPKKVDWAPHSLFREYHCVHAVHLCGSALEDCHKLASDGMEESDVQEDLHRLNPSNFVNDTFPH